MERLDDGRADLSCPHDDDLHGAGEPTPAARARYPATRYPSGMVGQWDARRASGLLAAATARRRLRALAAPERRRPKFASCASACSSPVLVTQAPGEPHRLYVVEQPGRIRVVETGSRPGAVPRPPLARLRGRRAGPARPRVPAAVRAVAPSTSTTRRAGDGATRDRALSRRDGRADPGSARGDPARRAAVREPQRRQPRRSGPTASCGSASATAAPPATRRAAPRTPTALLGKMFRLDVAPGEADAGARRDRAAQPVALQLRPQDRRPLDRRRRPERGRGDRRAAAAATTGS